MYTRTRPASDPLSCSLASSTNSGIAVTMLGNRYTSRNNALICLRPKNLSRLTAYAPGMATARAISIDAVATIALLPSSDRKPWPPSATGLSTSS
jgi:hypothetical protein